MIEGILMHYSTTYSVTNAEIFLITWPDGHKIGPLTNKEFNIGQDNDWQTAYCRQIILCLPQKLLSVGRFLKCD